MALKNALIMQNDNGTTTTAIQIDTAITSNNVPVVINASDTEPKCVTRILDGACIPFDPANTDFAQAKLDLSEGAELQNADGVAMTQAEVDSFLLTLP